MNEDEEYEDLERRLNYKPKEQAMNREDIIRMARGAGFTVDEADFVTAPKTIRMGFQLELERFAALVAAAAKAEENEACAQFLESIQLGSLPDDTALHYARLLKGFAEGIRARKENT